MRTVSRWLPPALAGEEEAVHQMRVAGRRLGVALALLARKPKGRRVRRALRVLRKLTRAAGASRDLDVCFDLFGERVKSLGAPTQERTVLGRRLLAARRRSRARMVEALLDLEIARLRRDLRSILSHRADDPFRIVGRVRDARDVEGGALLAGFEAIGDRYDPDGLHRLRGRARRLRYAAEVSDALRGQDSEAPTLLKKVQEQVGLVHDNHVLAAWLEAQAGVAARKNESLVMEAHAQAAFFGEAGRACHRAFLEQGPLELIRQALEGMDQTRPAAVGSHGAQRTPASTPSSDGPVTFPLQNRSGASREEAHRGDLRPGPVPPPAPDPAEGRHEVVARTTSGRRRGAPD
jgi:CHAD domain-containing protein